jgi:hypothetical protein
MSVNINIEHTHNVQLSLYAKQTPGDVQLHLLPFRPHGKYSYTCYRSDPRGGTATPATVQTPRQVQLHLLPFRPYGRYSYTCYSFSTPAIETEGCSGSRPGRLTSGRDSRYPLYRKLSGPRGRYRWFRKVPPPLGYQPRPLQRVTGRCTRYIIPSVWIT